MRTVPCNSARIERESSNLSLTLPRTYSDRDFSLVNEPILYVLYEPLQRTRTQKRKGETTSQPRWNTPLSVFVVKRPSEMQNIRQMDEGIAHCIHLPVEFISAGIDCRHRRETCSRLINDVLVTFASRSHRCT